MTAEQYVELWRKFREGDESAYTTLYNGFFSQLFNYGRKFTCDTSLVEDAIQDLYVRIWNSRQRIADPQSVKNYLFKSFRNILFRKMKVQGRFTGLDDMDSRENFLVTFSTADMQNIRNTESRLEMAANIRYLSHRQQEIVFLRFYEGFSYEEISEIMAIDTASAYKLMYKALDSLQRILSRYKAALIFLNIFF
jgi:RNA polymerase sigma factor (sigma-70 family)